MKRYIIVAITLLALNSCSDSKETKEIYPVFWKIENYDGVGISDVRLYEVDSCEYIGIINGMHSDYLTHKGNCKYCKQRSLK